MVVLARVVVVAGVVVEVLVDEVDDVGNGAVELVQAARVMVKTTITAMPTLLTVIIVSPITRARASGDRSLDQPVDVDQIPGGTEFSPANVAEIVACRSVPRPRCS